MERDSTDGEYMYLSTRVLQWCSGAVVHHDLSVSPPCCLVMYLMYAYLTQAEWKFIHWRVCRRSESKQRTIRRRVQCRVVWSSVCMSLSFIAPPQAKLGLLIHPSYLPPGHCEDY
jgi:hypothetical protein